MDLEEVEVRDAVRKEEKSILFFIDLEKAIDRVQWKKLLEILRRNGVDWKERRLINNTYLHQKSTGGE